MPRRHQGGRVPNLRKTKVDQLQGSLARNCRWPVALLKQLLFLKMKDPKEITQKKESAVLKHLSESLFSDSKPSEKSDSDDHGKQQNAVRQLGPPRMARCFRRESFPKVGPGPNPNRSMLIHQVPITDDYRYDEWYIIQAMEISREYSKPWIYDIARPPSLEWTNHEKSTS